jgi:hypothetical protein
VALWFNGMIICSVHHCSEFVWLSMISFDESIRLLVVKVGASGDGKSVITPIRVFSPFHVDIPCMSDGIGDLERFDTRP